MKLTKTMIGTTALILVLVTSMFVTLQPSSVAAQDQTSTPTPEKWIKLITQTPEGAWRYTPGVTKYPCVVGYRQNPGHTGYSEGPGPKTAHILWRSDSRLGQVGNWPCITVDNGIVYVTKTGTYAFDAYTGELLWKHSPSGWSNLVAGGYVWIGKLLGKFGVTEYYGGEDGVIGIPTTGEVYFRIANATGMGTVSPFNDPIYGAYTLFFGDCITGGTVAYTLDCWDSRWKLNELWRSPYISTGEGGESLCYSDGRLYGESTAEGGGLACVNATTGELLWRSTVYHSAYEFAVGDGLVFWIADVEGNTLSVLNATTGELLWTFSIEGTYTQCVGVGYGRVYLTGLEENKMYCLNETTGELLWTFEADGMLDYYNPIIADGAVYFDGTALTLEHDVYLPSGTFEGYVYCVNATTGDLIWKYKTPSAGTMIAIADGILYVATQYDCIYAFGKGPTTTNIEVTPSSLTLGQNVLISGSVIDMSPFSQQHPELQSPMVAGVPVVLSYVKDGTWTDFATVYTDSAGTFMYNWSPPDEGAYKIVARFEGNDAYYWSSAQAVVQVGPARAPEAPAYTTIDIVILVAAVTANVVGVVSIYLIRKQRK